MNSTGVRQGAYKEELVRLRGGNLLKEIVERMAHKLKCLGVQYRLINEGETNKSLEPKDCHWINRLKYYAYSAHDTTVAALACTFGDEERLIPGGLPHYTASLALELWLTPENQPVIKVLYHSAYHEKYLPITDLIQHCPQSKEFCPLNDFEQSRIKLIPLDILKECGIKKKHKGSKMAHYV